MTRELLIMGVCILGMGLIAGWVAALALAAACAVVYSLAFLLTLKP